MTLTPYLKWLLISSIMVVTGACGPSLQRVNDNSSLWTSSQECAQGPFELSWQTRGERWGEGVIAQLRSQQPFFGRWRLELDGKQVARGMVRTRSPRLAYDRKGRRTQRWQADKPGQSTACQTRPDADQLVKPQADPVPSRTDGRVARAPGVLQRGATLINSGPSIGRHVHGFLRWMRSNPQPDGGTALAAGRTLTLRVWSDRPQHWRGAALRVTTVSRRPSVPEAEYIAHLRQQEVDRRKARADRAKEAARRQAKRQQRRRSRSGFTRRRSSRASPTQRQRRRQLAERERLRTIAQARRDLYRARRYIESAKRPNGPPPAPYDEIAPRRPHRSARWIGGHWRWRGRQWSWIPGWWKVNSTVARTAATGISCGTCPPPPASPLASTPPRLIFSVGVRAQRAATCRTKRQRATACGGSKPLLRLRVSK